MKASLSIILLVVIVLLDDGFARADDLHEAVKRGDTRTVKNLLSKGSNVDLKDKNGQTPLILAAELGYKEIVELLLANGADVNTRDSYGCSPLWLAASAGHRGVLELLLSKGADVNVMDNSGFTPLHEAAGGGHTEAVLLLLAKGSNVNVPAKNEKGWSPLHFAVLKGNMEVVALLLSKGANPNAKGKDGYTPSTMAIKIGQDKMIDLFKRNSDISAGLQKEKLQKPLGIDIEKIDPGACFAVFKPELGLAFVSISNSSETADELINAQTDFPNMTAVLTKVTAINILPFQMKGPLRYKIEFQYNKVDKIGILPKSKISLVLGFSDYSILLMDISPRLKIGNEFTLILLFRVAKEKRIKLKFNAIGMLEIDNSNSDKALWLEAVQLKEALEVRGAKNDTPSITIKLKRE